MTVGFHDDVIKWRHFPRHWLFVRGIHRSPMNSPHKGQWRRALMFSLISAWINGWVNNRETGDLRRHPVHYDVVVMLTIMANPMRYWASHRRAKFYIRPASYHIHYIFWMHQLTKIYWRRPTFHHNVSPNTKLLTLTPTSFLKETCSDSLRAPVWHPFRTGLVKFNL